MCNENLFVHMYYSAFTIVAHTNVHFGYGGGGSKIISKTWPVRGPADLNWGRDQKVERCQFQQDRDRQRRETSGRSEGLLEIHGLVLPYEVYIVFLLFWDCEIFFGFFHESRLNCKKLIGNILLLFWMTETQICSNRQKHTFYLILFVETCWDQQERDDWGDLASEKLPAAKSGYKMTNGSIIPANIWNCPMMMLCGIPGCHVSVSATSRLVGSSSLHHWGIMSSELLGWDLQRRGSRKQTKTMTSSLKVPISPFYCRRHSWVWYVKMNVGDPDLLLLPFTVWVWIHTCEYALSPKTC